MLQFFNIICSSLVFVSVRGALTAGPHVDYRAHGIHDNRLLYGRSTKRFVCIFSHGNHHDSGNGCVHFLRFVYAYTI